MTPEMFTDVHHNAASAGREKVTTERGVRRDEGGRPPTGGDATLARVGASACHARYVRVILSNAASTAFTAIDASNLPRRCSQHRRQPSGSKRDHLPLRLLRCREVEERTGLSRRRSGGWNTAAPFRNASECRLTWSRGSRTTSWLGSSRGFTAWSRSKHRCQRLSGDLRDNTQNRETEAAVRDVASGSRLECRAAAPG
jgi:hypothetical protein